MSNDAAGIAALAAFCRRHGAELAVMEATGGYERMAFLLFWQEGVPCALANTRGVRRFAEAMGALALPWPQPRSKLLGHPANAG